MVNDSLINDFLPSSNTSLNLGCFDKTSFHKKSSNIFLILFSFSGILTYSINLLNLTYSKYSKNFSFPYF